jgi:prevent-host-death family protein
MEAGMPAPDPPEPGETRVGIRELRHDFRAWLQRVRAGERLVITDRGVPVAELGPPRPARSQLQRWIDEGLVIPATGSLRVGWKEGDPITTDGTDALEELREERLP